MQVAIDVSWSETLRQKEKLREKSNKLENKKRANHEHQIGDYIKIVHEKNTRMRPTKLSPPSEGPCQIVEVHANGIVKTQHGGHREDTSITRIAPLFCQRITRAVTII